MNPAWLLLVYVVAFWSLAIYSMRRRNDYPNEWRVWVGLFVVGPILFPIMFVRYGWRCIARRCIQR